MLRFSGNQKWNGIHMWRFGEFFFNHIFRVVELSAFLFPFFLSVTWMKYPEPLPNLRYFYSSHICGDFESFVSCGWPPLRWYWYSFSSCLSIPFFLEFLTCVWWCSGTGGLVVFRLSETSAKGRNDLVGLNGEQAEMLLAGQWKSVDQNWLWLLFFFLNIC